MDQAGAAVGQPADEAHLISLSRRATGAATRRDLHRQFHRRPSTSPHRYRTAGHHLHWRALRAVTSCNFFCGDAWLQRCPDDLDQATRFLDQAGSRLT